MCCDICSDFTKLLDSYITRVSNNDNTDDDDEEEIQNDAADLDRYFNKNKILLKSEFERLFAFVQIWFQRQCLCFFRDTSNCERICAITDGLIHLVIKQLYVFNYQPNHLKENEKSTISVNQNCWIADDDVSNVDANGDERWTYKEIESLFHLFAKAFLVNYPLYIPYKPIGKTENRAGMFTYVDYIMHDVSPFLMKNVDMFCKLNGVSMIADCFDHQDLPITVAHAMITVVCNLKMWLNARSTANLFIPLRSKVLRYMCQMSDKDLRTPTIKLISDYMWNTIKDPMDVPITFDKDGLDLAFKYFTSPTLTMRMAGIAQINSQVTTFNEICNSDSLMEYEMIGQHLANWLTDNNIVVQIFGPNMHVEIIKQSLIILNFLAMENKITNDDIELIWAAAQLKHCSKQVYDLLQPLVKNLEPGPVSHLYSLIYKIDIKDLNEQSLMLASTIIKFMWTSSSSYYNMLEGPHLKMMRTKHAVTSGSDNSAIDADNTDLETSSEGEIDVDGPTPTKKLKLSLAGLKSLCKADLKVEIEDRNEDPIIKEVEKEEVSICATPLKALKLAELVNTTKTPDVKASHEEKKHKSPEEIQSVQKSKIPVLRCNTRKIHSEDEIDVEEDDDDDELEDEEDDEDDEGDNEMTESDEEINPMHRRMRQPRRIHHLRHIPRHLPVVPVKKTERSMPLLLNDMLEDTMNHSDASVSSSRMSTKSEKNMADFDGEEPFCDDELLQLASHQHSQGMPQMMAPHINFHTRYPMSKGLLSASLQDIANILPFFNLETVYKPGSTLLWDVMQDENIHLLPENLAGEAEKILTGLICYNTDKAIKMKFIEGCLENLQKNRSVVISLRLLPKIFASFQQQSRSCAMDVNQITYWAYEKHAMMERFFRNLKTYTDEHRAGIIPFYFPHSVQVQVRLNFLTHVYSTVGLPDSVKLSTDQLITLWDCLVEEPATRNDLFEWLQKQVHGKSQHALGGDSLRRLYTDLMPRIDPETISGVALSVLQYLCNMVRAKESPLREFGDRLAMEHIWRIALMANRTDVSITAMQYINHYYMNRQLENEPIFIEQCMEKLSATAIDLTPVDDSKLMRIQRALFLLKTNLDTFRRRYGYHLRRWALEGQGISSHVPPWSSGAVPLHISVHAASMPEKVVLDMCSTDYVAELRAEVVKWWETSMMKRCQLPEDSPKNSSKSISLHDGTLRLISQGQELLLEYDEKTLAELCFKDNQIVYISMGTCRYKKRGEDTPSLLPPPRREHIPTLLLLLPQNFDMLFELMHMLSGIPIDIGKEHFTRTQMLSRRVWDILTLLPTSPSLLQGFQRFNERDADSAEPRLTDIIDPSTPQKLMYSLYIIETLVRPVFAKNTMSQSASRIMEETTNSWCENFIRKGGLKHLFDILMSGMLQKGTEWHQDCLTMLLKLICQLGVPPEHRHMFELFDCFGITNLLPMIGVKSKRKRAIKQDKLVLPRLNKDMLNLMNVETVIPLFTSLLMEIAYPQDLSFYKTGFWGRAQLLHFLMALFLSWANTEPDIIDAMLSTEQYPTWLLRLVLEDPDPAVRREICTALYRLCSASAKVAPTLLREMVKFVDKAEQMQPQRNDEEGKEPHGATCRDYFWLLCRLIDLLPEEVKNATDSSVIVLSDFAAKVWQSLVRRESIEQRFNTVEDDGLVGMFNVLRDILRYDTVFKISQTGVEALNQTFEYLFALPDKVKRDVPKCKTLAARSAAYDLLIELVKGCTDNYKILHAKVLNQHKPGQNAPYPWDYWPQEDGRSECGYVGLTNLGATCYMASCMQHLFMMPEARDPILRANCSDDDKHSAILKELQKMFGYLLESQRKTYNPRSLCKVYTMDHQPLNTAEQKDMAEFFIDLVSKLEEMTPELKELVKNLFGGTITNNVVSLDCNHVSSTIEEFYTVRCQVADMKNLDESLREITVKDTLEGDNMYTCSCGRKVRAEKRCSSSGLQPRVAGWRPEEEHLGVFEKRLAPKKLIRIELAAYSFGACFKKLPQILCFNTMRYTFNMLTMTKEKVNTHFSFPRILDMSHYVEKTLMPQEYQEEKEKREKAHEAEESYLYSLFGVTVHTGTADGGHYYSFIKDRKCKGDQWFLFNDAEVKPFDPAQLPHECYGGEMTGKTYDTVSEKFLDLSFEKTNSAYMLFYERCGNDVTEETFSVAEVPPENQLKEEQCHDMERPSTVKLSKEMEECIWQDNMQFLQDKNIFEHTYFQFMWQLCHHVPQTLETTPELTEMSAELSTTFFLEIFIHSKEKPTMVQWVEQLTKQFTACQNAAEWFLQHMSTDNWWPVQILIKCPNQMVRQMFQRLLVHVIQHLKESHTPLYLKTDDSDIDTDDYLVLDPEIIGSKSCITMFIKTTLSLLEHSGKPFWKHLSEYFTLYHEFCKMGDEECKFLLAVNTIFCFANFYLGQKPTDVIEVIPDDEEEEEILAIANERAKPVSLEKMITVIATLVEKSRGPDHKLHLSSLDFNIISGGKGYAFIVQQIKDNINLTQTRNLVVSLCRWNEPLAIQIISVLFSTLQKISGNPEICQSFYRILTLLCDINGMPGLPCFTELILRRVWDIADLSPYSILDWLSIQVPRNKVIANSVLAEVDAWVERFLVAHNNQRVRSVAAYLLVQLVPCQQFRQGYRINRVLCTPQRDIHMSEEATKVLHSVYMALLSLMKSLKQYTDIQTHGTAKLTAYFSVLNYCTISKTEKLLIGPYLGDLWQLFHPRLSEPTTPINHNKQSLLIYWNHVITDCPENTQIMLQNAAMIKNLPFNFIFADNDDQEVVMFNRFMLPSYYSILKHMCLHSRSFTRQLACHNNIAWALKNLSLYPNQYPAAVDELFELIGLFVKIHPDSSEQEIAEINQFRRQTILSYIQIIDARTGWLSLIHVIRTLVESDDDRLFFIFNGGLSMCFQSFQMLHNMYHEATACHVYAEMLDVVGVIYELFKCLHEHLQKKEVQNFIMVGKDWTDVYRKLFTLLNSYNCGDMRSTVLDTLKEMALVLQSDLASFAVPFLAQYHRVANESMLDMPSNIPMGPYFPRRNHKPPPIFPRNSVRPIRPIMQTIVHQHLIDVPRGVDPEFDKNLTNYYSPYHSLVSILCRIALDCNSDLTEQALILSTKVGLEAVSLHSSIFPAFWLELDRGQNAENSNHRDHIAILTRCKLFHEYVESVLMEERMSLMNDIIYSCISKYLPMVADYIVTEQNVKVMNNMISHLDLEGDGSLQFAGTLRSISLVYKYTEASSEIKDKLAILMKKLESQANTSLASSDSPRRKKFVPCSTRKSPIEEDDEQKDERTVGAKRPPAKRSSASPKAKKEKKPE